MPGSTTPRREDVAREPAVADHHPLGRAGRARGVDDVGEALAAGGGGEFSGCGPCISSLEHIYLHVYPRRIDVSSDSLPGSRDRSQDEGSCQVRRGFQSRWVADLIREKTAARWPESLIKLVGTWADDDFPSHEEIRAGIGEDLPREPF